MGAEWAIGSHFDPGLCWGDVPWLKLFAQLYVNPERSCTQEYVQKLEAAGVRSYPVLRCRYQRLRSLRGKAGLNCPRRSG